MAKTRIGNTSHKVKVGKFEILSENDFSSLNWKNQRLRQACCDCGLVHVFRFWVDGDILVIKGKRDERLTKTFRRKQGITVDTL